jgi:hypothetical protein
VYGKSGKSAMIRVLANRLDPLEFEIDLDDEE